jgi:MFS family permease
MFPSLSQILRKLSYPDLRDAIDIAAQHPTPIPGFKHQLCFFSHNFPENGGLEFENDSASKSNKGEAGFVVRAAKYLTQQQGVKCSQIVIITPYMLRVLELDYAQFAILTSTSIAAKTLTFSGCHRLGTRFGLRALLIVGGAGVAVVPVCWTLSRNFIELTIVHVLSGAAWALLEYASFQLLLASAPTRVRLQFLSMASCLSGLCQLVGSLVGAELLERFALSYDDLFAVSSVLRAIPLLLFVPTLPYSRVTELPRLLLRIFSVRPGTGSVERPLLPSTPPPPPRP